MGQQEVYDFFKENRRGWFTSKDITKKLNISLGSVTMSLKKLKQSRLIYYKLNNQRSPGRSSYQYKFKE